MPLMVTSTRRRATGSAGLRWLLLTYMPSRYAAELAGLYQIPAERPRHQTLPRNVRWSDRPFPELRITHVGFQRMKQQGAQGLFTQEADCHSSRPSAIHWARSLQT